MLSGLAHVTQLVNGEARSQFRVSLKGFYLLQNFPDVARGRSTARLSTCVCFLCLIQARETSGWETTGWWLCCQWTRILTRREPRTRVKMEKSQCTLIAKSNVYWQPCDGVMLCKANSCAPGAQRVSVRSLGGSVCAVRARGRRGCG